MKFVITKPEVAEALALSVDEFEELRDDLELRGFPLPLAGLGERWSIINVINWVNRKQIERIVQQRPATRETLPH